MAMGKIALQGSETYYVRSIADKALDGNTSDAASYGTCAHTTNSSHSWWKVDLGKSFLITGIQIYNRERGGMIVFFYFLYIVEYLTSTWSLCFDNKD